jgi:hypothetical protein
MLVRHWPKPKKVIVLRAGYSGPGWNDGMTFMLANWCGLTAESIPKVHFVETPEEAAEIAIAA